MILFCSWQIGLDHSVILQNILPESTDWVIFLSAGQKHRNSNRKQREWGDRHRRRHHSTTSSPIALAHPPARRSSPGSARSSARYRIPHHAFDNCRYLNHSRSLVHVHRFAVHHIAQAILMADVRPPPGQQREQPSQRVSAHVGSHRQPARGVVPAVW